MTNDKFYGRVDFSVSSGLVPWGDPSEFVHTVAVEGHVPDFVNEVWGYDCTQARLMELQPRRQWSVQPRQSTDSRSHIEPTRMAFDSLM